MRRSRRVTGTNGSRAVRSLVESSFTDINRITEARAIAESEGDDAALLALRELELAHAALPPVIDGVRRSRLLQTDPISTTWEGWHLTGGQRVFLRCIRPRWRTDPVMLRRMAKGANPECSWHPSEEWPHLRVVQHGGLLADRFPVEDMASTERLARILGEGLAALNDLHASGAVHAGPLERFLVETSSGLRLVSMDPFLTTHSAVDDIRQLAAIVVALDPLKDDPVALLAEEWLDAPPPTAQDGIRLLTRCLSGVLLSERHRLTVAARSVHRFDRKTRLARAVRTMARAVSPPVGRVCVKVGTDGTMIVVESDGETIRGGAVADAAEQRFLPVIYTPASGLDAQSARFVLRSWAMRSKGNETSRALVQAQLGSTDATADRLVRWMSAMARLRAARLILQAG